jgi:hypothetical protein
LAELEADEEAEGNDDRVFNSRDNSASESIDTFKSSQLLL